MDDWWSAAFYVIGFRNVSLFFLFRGACAQYVSVSVIMAAVLLHTPFVMCVSSSVRELIQQRLGN